MISELKSARLLFSAEQISRAITAQAALINGKLGHKNPMVALTLLNGGIVYTGQLLPLLDFHLQLDSISVSRYRDQTQGGQLHWHAYPGIDLEGSVVLLLDDIFDQGITLAHVKDWCLSKGAKEVYTAVLAWKKLNNASTSLLATPDFFALEVPDKFVVGMGMDYAGKFRNANGIYAMDDY
ncbi:hypoxanthine phosphoribosyltransferase [Alteromonadaceae bacterium Bs31]|nr:hypoxanthine phosphoribosyltransferase [Alteromonadaceae bacterium Bs31]